MEINDKSAVFISVTGINMDDSLELKIAADKIIFTDNGQTAWTLKIDEIKFIGEYTTNHGPFADDYFFVFAENLKEWWQAPNQAVKNEQFWTNLGLKLGAPIAPNLFASTEWKTNVLFPRNLEGEELFQIIKVDKSKRTIWRRIFGIKTNDEKLELSDNIKKLF